MTTSASLRALIAAIVFSSVSSSLAEECITLVANSTGSDGGYSTMITLDVGDTATLASFTSASPIGSGSGAIEVVVGGITFNEPPILSAGIPNPIKVAGPATIRVGIRPGYSSLPIQWWGTFNISRAAALQNAVPTNAVVIPENASGQYQVILESSTDLVTWTAANPGSYGGSTQQRFFRTRIVQTN